MSPVLDLSSLRSRQARFSKKIGTKGYLFLLLIGGLFVLMAIVLGVFVNIRLGILSTAPVLIFWLPAIWWKRDLSVLKSTGNDYIERLSIDILSRLDPGIQLKPLPVWEVLKDHWQSNFIIHHLLLQQQVVSGLLNGDEKDFIEALKVADQFAIENKSETIELGFIVAGLLLTSPEVKDYLISVRAQPEDVRSIANWLARNINADIKKAKYGGIARDWAFGFTPLLDKFGHNISLTITKYGARFNWLTKSDAVKAIEAAFSNHSNAVILVGMDGIGKSNSVYALAQKLIEGDTVKELSFHQIIELNATDITSRAHGPGELEQIMISLANEAAHAGHIILFLDDAQLFMSTDPGSFDARQILLSIIQARSVPIILAMAPNDYQNLKSSNQSLANLLSPIIMQELPENDVIKVLEDASLSLENRNKIIVTYEALKEAYRLSGRYNQDEAYPGKAIKLLNQAVPHCIHSIMTAHSVQLAIEQSRGVKVSGAAPAEADALLHLEDQIHTRMINQSYAVSVVANALRRSRAGVTNPKRPIGSFLFLGPTGVGKTELAKSVAATYFGAEQSMIRIDMSEYQQPDDVQRLLSTGQEQNKSLLMSIRQQPFSVVLLDEIEKAHPNILNLLLQLLDEGQLTDASGRAASFKDTIIIATSNAGANTIRERISKGESLDSFSNELIDELITSGQFKPELLNRFDEIVFFRPLKPEELVQVVTLMINEVNATLTKQNISIELTQAAIEKIVSEGNDPRLGARPMRRALQRIVENTVAQKILKGEARPGDHILLDVTDLTS